MEQRKLLIRGTLITAFIGIILISLPFMQSLSPNKKSDASLLRIDLSSIKPGTFKVIPNDRIASINNFNWATLVLRKQDGSFQFWDVPIQNNAIGMPDRDWWRPFHPCSNFGPTITNGQINESQPIKCHDLKQPEGISQYWLWDINGTSLKPPISNMLKSPGSIEGNYFVYNKRS